MTSSSPIRTPAWWVISASRSPSAASARKPGLDLPSTRCRRPAHDLSMRGVSPKHPKMEYHSASEMAAAHEPPRWLSAFGRPDGTSVAAMHASLAGETVSAFRVLSSWVYGLRLASPGRCPRSTPLDRALRAAACLEGRPLTSLMSKHCALLLLPFARSAIVVGVLQATPARLRVARIHLEALAAVGASPCPMMVASLGDRHEEEEVRDGG
jgi:hypothetical protein